jgi:subtilisin family serine protease
MPKKIILNLLFLCVFAVLAQAQDSVFYYDEFGGKIYLQKDNTTKIIHFANETATQNHSLFNQLNVQNITIDTLNKLMYKITGNVKQKATSDLLFSKQINNNILYISDMLRYGGSVLWESDGIIVKIFPNTELSDLLETNHIPYKEFKRLGSNSQTYLVTLDVSEQSAIEYANWLMENKLLVMAQPSFWRLMQTLNNPYFSSQWGFQNIGQYDGTAGVDIKANYAWELATGSDIKVAVIDEGVDLTHPDLVGNLLSGYDATDGQDKAGATHGGYGGFNNDDSHGTACSGIIAAHDNNIGIKGIAYDAKIIPIRISYSINPRSGEKYISKDDWTVKAIQWAWENGADVLSCSWTVNPNSAITNEINSAVAQGRGGKGCVVVFGAGNSNESTVFYPACLPNVISVGGISPCGERKRSSSDRKDVGINQPDPAGVSCDGEKAWGSNYGQNLDVVAPCVLVPTTDLQGNVGYNPNKPVHTSNKGNKITSDFSNQDYTVWFNGTSAACPHVAGVAALVLSADPSLTGEQVRYIIKSTAQKIRPDLYAYNLTNVSPYALWNQEVGYGLVDAYAAVQAAKCTKSLDLVIGDTPDDAGIEPNPTPNANILDCSNIWIRNTNSTAPQFAKPNIANEIYVRIKNNGCQHYTGEDSISLYWAKGGTDLSWPGKWDGSNLLLGNHIETIKIQELPPFREGIETFIWWDVPNPVDYDPAVFADPSHFYLLAKIKSKKDPLSFQETPNVEANVRNNNNIACKSIRIGSGVDLIIKDTYYDKGIEPNPTSSDMWSSPDIWVRHVDNGDSDHQNPRNNEHDRVYVRVKNIGKVPSFGEETLYLYWSKANTDQDWPKQWDIKTYNTEHGGILGAEIGRFKMPPIQPGEDIVISFNWIVPDTNMYSHIPDPWHFCLLARIEAPDNDPMTFPETKSVSANIKNNNNIAGRSVYIGKNSERVDLMIKDHDKDIGDIGNYPYWEWAKSPDIWVRNSNDGYRNFTSQDPEYSPNFPVYVYVRVRNRLSEPFFGKEGHLALYWTKASSMSSWPQNWDGSDPNTGNIIGRMPLSGSFILPNGEKIFEFEWKVPNPSIINEWAVCLLARIEDITNDAIINFNDLGKDIYNNNNIAERNVTIVDMYPLSLSPDREYPYGRFMYIGNASREPASFDFNFGVAEDNSTTDITKYAEVRIKPDDAGWAILQPHFEKHPDVRITEDKVFIITKGNVTLKDIHFEPETRIAILVEFHFPLEDVSTNGTFHYRIAQKYSSSDILTGAENFIINRYPSENKERFTAHAGEDVYVDIGETVILIAEQVGEEAIYRWYDQKDGNLVHDGREFTTEVTEEKKYLLKVTAISNDFTSSDEVEVKLKPNRIENIFPNPTDGILTVMYKINKANEAYLRVTNSNFFSFTNIYMIDVNNNNKIIDMPEYPSGIYILTLVCDGRIVESITFIKE